MENPSESCPVCHEAVTIYAIGNCDHPICYRCSVRMRALCDQMYCPICRTDLSKVYIVNHMQKESDIPRYGFLSNRKLKVFMEDDIIKQKVDKLLEHRCSKCKGSSPFRTFKELQTHMRKEHTLFYCDLCVDHLKIFTSQRKCYTRQDLATHRRVGDKNDSSYKGHALCRFCDERYMDNDELYRHLRKDHYYCHFCEAEGCQDFYSEYEDLKFHFKEKHYLCEQEDCGASHVQFTHAFKSNIDLKAHIASEHNKGMSRAQARQARNIDIEIQLAPRRNVRDRGKNSMDDYADSRRSRDNRSQGQKPTPKDRFREEDVQRAIQISLQSMKEEEKKTAKKVEEEPLPQEEKISHDEENFPTLGAMSAGQPSCVTNDSDNRDKESEASLAKRLALANHMSVQHGRLGMADFPTLSQDNSPRVSPIPTNFGKPQQPVVSTAHRNPVPSASSNKKKYSHVKAVDNQDFPELPSAKNNEVPSVQKNTWISTSQEQQISKPRSASSSLSDIGFLVTKSSKSAGGKTRQFNMTPSQVLTDDKDKDFPSLGGGNSQENSLLNWSKISSAPKTAKQIDWFNIGDEEFSIDKLKGDKDSNAYIEISNKSNKKKKEKDKKKTKNKNDSASNNASNQNNSSTLNNIADLLTTVQAQQSSFKANDEVEKPGMMATKTEEKSKVNETSAPSKKKVQKKSFNPDSVPHVSDVHSFGKETKQKQEKQQEQIPKNKNAKDFKEDFPQLGNSQQVQEATSNEEKQKMELVHKSKNTALEEDFPHLGKSKKELSVTQKEEKRLQQPLKKNENVSSLEEDFPQLHKSQQGVERSIKQGRRQNEKHHTEPLKKNKNVLELEEDFPQLSKSQKAPPPGFSKGPVAKTNSGPKSPPGFSESAPSKKLPPGFSLATVCAPLVDSNSINDALKGIVLKDLPPVSNSMENHVYTQTENFQNRNQQLISDIQRYVANNQDKFNEFKACSREFRNGQIEAVEYFEICERLLGKQNFVSIFPELLVLLPDISKQQDLLNVYNKKQNEVINITGRKGKAAWSSDSTKFLSCHACRQVLIPKDYNYHLLIHDTETDFPSLSAQKSAGQGSGHLRSWVQAK